MAELIREGLYRVTRKRSRVETWTEDCLVRAEDEAEAIERAKDYNYSFRLDNEEDFESNDDYDIDDYQDYSYEVTDTEEEPEYEEEEEVTFVDGDDEDELLSTTNDELVIVKQTSTETVKAKLIKTSFLQGVKL